MLLFVGEDIQGAKLSRAAAQSPLRRILPRAAVTPFDLRQRRTLRISSRKCAKVRPAEVVGEGRGLSKSLKPYCICSWVPLEARRAARLDEGVSTRTVRVPQQGTFCVPCQVEFRSRLIEAGSTGAPRERGARLQGRPSFGYFSWPRKKSDQPPGCPRPLFLAKRHTSLSPTPACSFAARILSATAKC